MTSQLDSESVVAPGVVLWLVETPGSLALGPGSPVEALVKPVYRTIAVDKHTRTIRSNLPILTKQAEICIAGVA